MTLSIIIPIYNTKNLTINCLKSIFDNPPKSTFELIVIDNASSDGTFETINKSFPKVILIKNRENVGYAKANNQGVKIAKGKHILLLNSDVQVKKGDIQDLVDFINSRKKVGAAAAKLINPNGTTQYYYHRRFPTFISFAASLLENYFKISTPIAKNYFMLKEKFDREIELEQAATSALIIKKITIKKIGYLFDEKLPLFFNDTDLSKRIKKANLKITLSPNTKIVHLRNKSTDLLNPFIVREELFISMLYYFKKHRQIFSYLATKVSLVILLLVILALNLLNIFTSYFKIPRKKTANFIKNQLQIILSLIVEKRHISNF